MAYLAVDCAGNEWIFPAKPKKDINGFWWMHEADSIKLPQGTIERLVGKKLTWDDDPYEFITLHPDKKVVITRNIQTYIKNRPDRFPSVPEIGEEWFLEREVTYPNVNQGNPVLELINGEGSWLRLPKRLVEEGEGD